jgi:hypothetical protein
VTRETLEHVIEKRHTSVNFSRAASIELQCDADPGLARLTFDGCGPSRRIDCRIGLGCDSQWS